MLPVTGDMATAAATAETPTDHGNKATHPQGTSPMARDAEKDNELDIQSLGMEIDNKGDASTEKDDQDSITRVISSTRKELFTSAAIKSFSKSSGAAKIWHPITTRDMPAQGVGVSRGATFAAEMVFHEHSSTPTDGDKMTLRTNDCVVRIRFKLQPCNVKETLVGLFAHCLLVLQERDKSACILNRHKTLEARRVSDLP